MDRFTDLATEFGCNLTKNDEKESQVDISFGVKVTRMDLRSKIHADSLGKRSGLYYTIEPVDGDAQIAKHISIAMKSYDLNFSRVLVVGLGNPTYEADSLGTYVSDNLNIEVGKLMKFLPMTSVKTGIESHDLIKAVVDKVKPSLVIAIDSLATISPKRIGECYQITSAGLVPGSGVGNDRQILDKKSLGVDVIAIGVPFVCDMRRWVSSKDAVPCMVVTPSHIDTLVSKVALNISDGIKMALT